MEEIQIQHPQLTAGLATVAGCCAGAATAAAGWGCSTAGCCTATVCAAAAAGAGAAAAGAAAGSGCMGVGCCMNICITSAGGAILAAAPGETIWMAGLGCAGLGLGGAALAGAAAGLEGGRLLMVAVRFRAGTRCGGSGAGLRGNGEESVAQVSRWSGGSGTLCKSCAARQLGGARMGHACIAQVHRAGAIHSQQAATATGARSWHALALAARGGHIVRLLGQQKIEGELLRARAPARGAAAVAALQVVASLHRLSGQQQGQPGAAAHTNMHPA